MTVMAGSNGILCKSMYKVNDIYSILNKTNKTNILVFSDLMIFTLPTPWLGEFLFNPPISNQKILLPTHFLFPPPPPPPRP
jgi:hypothetical protein